jgi:carboxymethylenebutenolidase
MTNDPIKNLLHLYVDGAFNRRELITRLTRYTGSVAAATAVVESAGLANAQTASCPAGVQVAENDPSIFTQMITIHGEGGPLFVYQVLPRDYLASKKAGVLVIHENRGLTDHIKDVTRRAAKAGYVAWGVDLLSRQGGTDQFSDPQQQAAAYGRTTVEQRREDLRSAALTMRDQSYIRGDRIGVVGFCAGGGNVYELALNTDAPLSAAVAFYGPPLAAEQYANLRAPLLGIYAELDRGLTGRMPAVLTTLNTAQKPYAMHIYQGVNHAFHNDTGPQYDPAAACDAWARTLEFFNRHLNRA